jgi:aminopeptidase N
MKRLLLLFLSVLSVVYGNSQNNIDVLHYRYDIELRDNDDTIAGTAIIVFLVNESGTSVHFDLSGINKDKKGMTVSDVVFGNHRLGKPDFQQADDKLILNQSLKKGDTVTVVISYRGVPADGLIISKNKFGDRSFFSDNWPNRAHNWIPCNDNPADKATVEFIVTASSHYQVISNGEQIEETNLPGDKKLTHWKEDIPLPTKVMVIGAADFAVNYTGDVNCVPVYSWVFPGNKEKGFYDYAPAKDILAFFMNYIGPYPFKKLANVQSKTIFGGMENASAIFYFENSVTGKREDESLFAHEIVHQWFGDMATEKSFAHVWLSEGFATYLTHIYIESKYGTDSLNKEM